MSVGDILLIAARHLDASILSTAESVVAVAVAVAAILARYHPPKVMVGRDVEAVSFLHSPIICLLEHITCGCRPRLFPDDELSAGLSSVSVDGLLMRKADVG